MADLITGASLPLSPYITGLGLLGWTFDPNCISTNTAPTSQTIYAVSIVTQAGVTYTGIKLWVNVAGNGTAPTNFFVGLASYAAIAVKGTVLAQSSDLAASASLTTAASKQSFAFSTPYLETATGLRTILILQNGSFSVTQPTFFRAAAVPEIALGVSYTAGTGQSALPSNGALLPAAYSNSNNLPYWVGLY